MPASHATDRLRFMMAAAFRRSARTAAQTARYWILSKTHDLSPSYLRDARLYWNEFEITLGERSIAEFSPGLMQSVETDLRQNGNSKATVKKKFAWIKSVLNFSVDKGRLPYNPIAKVRSAKPDEVEIEFWEPHEATGFLGFAHEKYPAGSENEQTYLVYLTALHTGLRSAELWALKPRCMKTSLSVFNISEQWDLTTKTFRPPKGKRSRKVPLMPTVQKELERFIKAKGIGPNQTIFQTRTGTPIDHNCFKNRFFDPDIAQWGGTKLSLHGLRHTAATKFLSSGMSLKTVQQILGHRDIATTARYLHAVADDVKAAASAFDLAPSNSLRTVK